MNRFRNILVLVTGGHDVGARLERAAALAERNGAELTLFSVVESERTDRRIVLQSGDEFDVKGYLLETRLEELNVLAADLSDVEVTVEVTAGSPFVEVIRRVVTHDHDLVIVPFEETRWRRGAGGASTAMHLLRKCPVPVWVDSGTDGLSNDVAVAVGPFERDPSEESLNVTLLELATSLAALRGGTVHVIHAWRLEGESMLRRGRHRPPTREVDEMVDLTHAAAEMGLKRLLDFQPDLDVPTEVHLVKGDAGSVVPDIVERVQPGVVVIGTLARTGLKGVFMGNTAEHVLGAIDTAVLTVKPRGFETPVGV